MSNPMYTLADIVKICLEVSPMPMLESIRGSGMYADPHMIPQNDGYVERMHENAASL